MAIASNMQHYMWAGLLLLAVVVQGHAVVRQERAVALYKHLSVKRQPSSTHRPSLQQIHDEHTRSILNVLCLHTLALRIIDNAPPNLIAEVDVHGHSPSLLLHTLACRGPYTHASINPSPPTRQYMHAQLPETKEHTLARLHACTCACTHNGTSGHAENTLCNGA